jgi:hypothetical protein
VASIAERYLQLGLRLGRHIDGLVDGYYGPPELKQAVDAEELRPADELAADVRALLDDVEGESDDQRRRWLIGQLHGLECVAEMIGGTEVPWVDAVRRCYGIDVQLVPEERFAEAHELFDRALPGDGEVAERLQAWNRAQEVAGDKVLSAYEALTVELRARTRDLVDLPEGEHIDAQVVTNQPWGAYNWYLGNLSSRIDINTDLPGRASHLAPLVAHEGYPGHHTEHACKEAGLVRARGRIEASILLIHTPECLVSEGIAQIALEQAFGDDWYERVAGILRPLGIAFDPETTREVHAAYRLLDDVTVNATYLTHERQWSIDEAAQYVQRWNLSEPERARKSVEFAFHPVWSIYTPTYSYGYRLARAYVDNDPAAFRRLLTEQLTTVDLLQAPAAA